MYKLCFYVPESHVEAVKTAVFNAGAGRQGAYQHCCWQTLGQGQFMPLEGSQPFIGEANNVAVVAEYKVEILCDKAVVMAAVKALKQAHPYEEPAFDVLSLVDSQAFED